MTYNVFSGTLNPTHFTSLENLEFIVVCLMNRQFKAGKHGSCDIMIRVVECTELWFLVLIRTSSAFNKQHKVECSIEKMSLDGQIII